jgi:hypothetical protein
MPGGADGDSGGTRTSDDDADQKAIRVFRFGKTEWLSGGDQDLQRLKRPLRFRRARSRA